MPHPYILVANAAGMRRDLPRVDLGGTIAGTGFVWNLQDFIPSELGAMLSGRGGWSYGDDGAMSGATSFKAVAYAPFTAGAQKLGVDQAGKLWNFGAGTSPGTAIVPGCNPVYHRGKIIIPNNDGTTAVKYFDGTDVGSLAGSPPAGQLASVYKDHAILAKSSANANRIWFSAAGDPTSWDTSFGYWDTTGDIVAVVPLLNAILIFHAGSTERLRGTIPPPGTDMVLEPFLDYGCIDPFSVALWRGQAVWASDEGIFVSNGATDLDLTKAAGLKTYWKTQMASYTSSWRIAGGVYQDHYICAINNGSTLVDCFVVDLYLRTMWRFGNFHANAFVSVGDSGVEELYMGLANAGRVGKVSTCWNPSASVKTDGDGTAPSPVVEGMSFHGWDRINRRYVPSLGINKFRYVYLDYDLRADSGDAPIITLQYATSPTGGYTDFNATLPATTDFDRMKRSPGAASGNGVHSNSFSVKAAVTGPYASCQIYAVEGTYEPIDVGAVA